MDEETKQGFADVMIHIEALKLVVRETLTIALADHANPSAALQSIREHIEKITEIVETATISGDHAPEYQKWFVEQVRHVAIVQLAPVAQQLIGPKRGGTSH